MINQKIILASQSPRRKQLLEWAEISYEVVVPSTDEYFPPGYSPEEAAIFIARNKALNVKERLTESPVILAADTMVVLDDHIIGKPVHREDAVSMLLALSGAVHKVITGVVLLQGEKELAFSDTTIVEFYPLSVEQIEYYIEKYRPYDKAGAYAIQEWIGVIGIKRIDGDFYNVMGLPVSKVIHALERFIPSYTP
ncbi:MAG: Maf family protein [Chitinophagaceae bacterium]|nr:Maf family protein [Chitinophagaceae bacterium]